MANLNEEIDIKQLIVITLNFFKKNKKAIIILLVLSAIVGVVKYKFTKPFYTNNLILTTNIVYEKSQNVYVSDIQPFFAVLTTIKENANNTDFLKNRLNLKPENLKSISIEVLKDKNISTTEMKNVIIIVNSFDKEVFPELEASIIDYCNSNDYLKALYSTQLQSQKNEQEIVKKYTRLVDSLSNSTKKSDVPIIVDFSKFIDLQSSINIIDSNNSPIAVVQHFSKYPLKVSKKVSNSIVFFFIFFVFGIVVLMLKDFFKYVQTK